MVHASSKSLIFAIAAVGGLIAYEYFRRQRSQNKGQLSSEKSGKMENETLTSHADLFSKKECALMEELSRLGQGHIFAGWPEPGVKDKEKRRFLAQLLHLDANYSGGLPEYIRNAKKLLRDAQDGKNPFHGFTPSVPQGVKLDYGSDMFQDLESEGVTASEHTAFVLVAGGLGERLGYSGIKVKLPVDSARNASFLQEYVEAILALEAKHKREGTLLPLAIMTSGDTHERTEQFLKENNYFGAKASQITLMKQEKVACLEDSEARLALEKDDQFAVQTKPHGHGDVHALLHSTGLVKKWRAAGLKWVCFFQDTNGLVFRGLPVALGVSARKGYDVNSLAVPRKAGEAIGAITCLTHTDGRKMTINVEYNQLEPLLRGTSHPEGDTNDDSGFSPFPGNINQVILKMEPYAVALDDTEGIIAEFVNPKYKDTSKQAFKSPTRLECMMQDFPRALPPSAAIGFTVINQVWAAYSPVKNSPADAAVKGRGGNPSHSATTGELDVYQVNCRALQILGAEVDGPSSRDFNGLTVDLWPRVSWSPHFAVTFADLKSKIHSESVHISKDSTLVIRGSNVTIKGLDLDGTLIAETGLHARLLIDGARIKNRGWAWQPVKEGPGKRPPSEEEAIRGFLVCRRESEELIHHAGAHTFPKPSAAPSPPKPTPEYSLA